MWYVVFIMRWKEENITFFYLRTHYLGVSEFSAGVIRRIVDHIVNRGVSYAFMDMWFLVLTYLIIIVPDVTYVLEFQSSDRTESRNDLLIF